MPSVFLGHHKVDRSFARRVAADLARSGAEVQLVETRGPSLECAQVIRRALDSSDCMAVVLSPDSAMSKWVCQDLKEALEQDSGAGKAAVWSLLHRECSVPGVLGQRPSADFRDPSGYETALDVLKRSLGLRRFETVQRSDAAREVVAQHAATDLTHLNHRLEHLEAEHAELGSELRPVAASMGRARLAQHQQAILQHFCEGTYRLRPAPVFLGRVIPRLARDVEFAFRESRVSILLADARSAPPISADPDLIDPAFFEILDGVFRYAGRGTKVEIEFECGEATVHTRLRSAGVISEPNFALDVFTEGRGRTPRGSSLSGPGAPLHLAQLVVSSHGGEITSTYEPSRSTNVVTVSLPQGVV